MKQSVLVTMNGALFDVATLGLKALPYLPPAVSSTHRQIELLEHGPSHLISPGFLRGPHQILHSFRYSPSRKVSPIKHQYFGCVARAGDNSILDKDGRDLGFQTIWNHVTFCDLFAVLMAQCRFNVCTRCENMCTDCHGTDLVECAFPLAMGTYSGSQRVIRYSPRPCLVGE